MFERFRFVFGVTILLIATILITGCGGDTEDTPKYEAALPILLNSAKNIQTSLEDITYKESEQIEEEFEQIEDIYIPGSLGSTLARLDSGTQRRIQRTIDRLIDMKHNINFMVLESNAGAPIGVRHIGIDAKEQIDNAVRSLSVLRVIYLNPENRVDSIQRASSAVELYVGQIVESLEKIQKQIESQ